LTFTHGRPSSCSTTHIRADGGAVWGCDGGSPLEERRRGSLAGAHGCSLACPGSLERAQQGLLWGAATESSVANSGAAGLPWGAAWLPWDAVAEDSLPRRGARSGRYRAKRKRIRKDGWRMWVGQRNVSFDGPHVAARQRPGGSILRVTERIFLFSKGISSGTSHSTIRGPNVSAQTKKMDKSPLSEATQTDNLSACDPFRTQI
jgi:hypothetical protein